MANKRTMVAAKSPTDVIRDIDAELVDFDGKRMTRLEASLRLTYMKALRNKDVNASIELQKIRDRCGVNEPARKIGVLVVPEASSLEEWSREAFEQQAPYRERRADLEEDF